jgi:hypothetical protein
MADAANLPEFLFAALKVALPLWLALTLCFLAWRSFYDPAETDPGLDEPFDLRTDGSD